MVPGVPKQKLRGTNVTNTDWYVLRVRRGFEAVVAHRLRQLDLEVFVPERKVTPFEEHHQEQFSPAGYVYCRFSLDNRSSVTSIPGVFDVLGAADPLSLDEKASATKCEINDLLAYPPKFGSGLE